MDKVLILSIVANAFAIVGILVEAYFDRHATDSAKKHIARAVTILALVIGSIIIYLGRREDAEKDRLIAEGQKRELSLTAEIKSDQTKQISQVQDVVSQIRSVEAEQKQLLDAQRQNLDSAARLLELQHQGTQQLTLLSLDRNLSGFEISYKPTKEEWYAVTKVYNDIKPNVKDELSYYDSPIIADRIYPYWKIDFEPVSLKEGRKWFGPVSTQDPESKKFEELLRAGTLPLLITWGVGSETRQEPIRGDYPSRITLSPDLFTFSWREPLLELNLRRLRANSEIFLRTRKRENIPFPNQLTFRSLDMGVKLMQTVHLEWKPQPSQEFRETLYKYASGPHRLAFDFGALLK